MKRNKATATVTYFTHSHNIEGCLANGSFVRKRGSYLAQYMNGDFMGEIDSIPKTMVEVPTELARELLPKCCR